MAHLVQAPSPAVGKPPTKRIPLAKPIFDDEMKQAALSALQNERFVLGESVFKFEEEFAQYCGTDHAVSTASGTAALTLSLIALGVRGHSAITSPASFVATANAVIHAEGEPRFADISTDTYTIDPAKVRQSITKKTKVIVPVHLYGFPAAMGELCDLAKDSDVAILEDACQAHGGSYDRRKLGSIGNAGCFSFYPAKNMTVGGDGGMVITNDGQIAEYVRSLRDCGRVTGSKYIHGRIGYTERLNTVQAAIGRVQLKRLDEWNERRRAIAGKYDRLLSDLDEVTIPPKGNPLCHPVYHLYVIRCRERDELRSALEREGIESGIHYTRPIHLQPIYRELFAYRGGEFPASEALCGEALSIPMHPNLTVEELEVVSETIHEFYHPTKNHAR